MTSSLGDFNREKLMAVNNLAERPQRAKRGGLFTKQ